MKRNKRYTRPHNDNIDKFYKPQIDILDDMNATISDKIMAQEEIDILNNNIYIDDLLNNKIKL